MRCRPPGTRPTVWGVQLHPEVDVEVVRPWAASDEGSHEARGIDQDALLRDDRRGPRPSSTSAWRPLAASFADLAAAAPGPSDRPGR